MRIFIRAGVAVLLTVLSAVSAHAAGGGKTPKDVNWKFEGVFGHFDKVAMQRGFQVFQAACQSCHGLEHFAFRSLDGLGFSEPEVRAIAASYRVTDGPDGEGQMYERPGRGSDFFPNPFANKEEAASINGKAPPDLSLMVKARANGANYVYSLLTGYSEDTHGIEVPAGNYYNDYYPGNIIAMAPPLIPDLVEYSDGTQATESQMAKDLVYFLTYVAEPHLEERKRMGIYVLIFLGVLAGFMYATKRRVWADVHH
jgi:ubiquinol-cytochrome c reductase cytochrome c1 subunit